MGTLFDQNPRYEALTTEKVISFGREIEEISNELGIKFNDAINLYLAKAKISDYDTKDEQLAGFGKILKSIVDAIENK